MPEFVSLLPRNRTGVELQIEQTLTGKFDPAFLDADIVRKLQEPSECPVNLLPWLAFALSVDVWSDGWSESVKRDVIDKSVAIHRKKGTLGAVKSAISALGIAQFDVLERKDNPTIAHGYFQLRFLADDPVINSRLKQQQLLSTVDSAKKLSAHYEAFLTAQGNLNQQQVVECFAVVYDKNNNRQFSRISATCVVFAFVMVYQHSCLSVISADSYAITSDSESLRADSEL